MAQSPRRFISNINFAIDQKFREHDIEIRFLNGICTCVPVGLKLKKLRTQEESAAV